MPTSLLSSDPPLWTLIDTYLLNLCETWAAQWTETYRAPVYIAEQVNPDTVGYPFILISGYERNLQDSEPVIGSGEYSISGIRYPYEIVVCAAFDTFGKAKHFAAAASASFSDMLRAEPTMGGLEAANGEFVEQFDFDDGEIYVRGVAGQAGTGKYIGGCTVAIIVHTEV